MQYLSEFIEVLQELLDEHGDVPVQDEEGRGLMIEMGDDETGNENGTVEIFA